MLTIANGDNVGTSGGMFCRTCSQARPNCWSEWVDEFEDANLYQSGFYGENRWGRDRVCYLTISRDSIPAAMAELRIVRLPYLKSGIAYLRWGPLFRRRNLSKDQGALEGIASGLIQELLVKRRYCLQIVPNLYEYTPEGNLFAEAFQSSVTRAVSSAEKRETFVLDISRTLMDIRSGFEQKWRNQLNRAERNDLVVISGTGKREFELFSVLYREMAARKALGSDTNMEEFSRLQTSLPERHRMRVFICLQGGVPVAGLVGGAFGNTGIYLHGATGNRGLESKGAYLLQWTMIQWLKERGFQYYDLGGSNREKNPGVFHFKKGIGGKELSKLPVLSISSGFLNRILAMLALKLKRSSLKDSIRQVEKWAVPRKKIG